MDDVSMNRINTADISSLTMNKKKILESLPQRTSSPIDFNNISNIGDRQDSILAATEYNEKIFLSELEDSLKEMREMKESVHGKSRQHSWRDLFRLEEE